MHMPHHQASFLPLQRKRLSQASLELSSSRGVFGSRESERKRREKREKKQNLKIKDFIYKNKNLQNYAPKELLKKLLLRLQNKRGLYRPPQGMKIPKTLSTWLS